MKKIVRGILVSVEGIDGSGKSTLVRNLSNYLINQGYPVMATREPGATALGGVVRSMIHRKDVPRHAQAEYLLFAADRAQHFQEVVIPALQQNMLVISDRMTDSSLVYQGYAHGLDRTMMQTINNWAMAGYAIDYTFYVKVDAATALQRLQARAQELTIFEEKQSFTQQLIQGFEHLYTNNPRVHTVDGTLSEQDLCMHAAQQLRTWINTHNLLQ